GSFRAGLAAENARRDRLRARGQRPGLHPYAGYLTGWLAWLAGAWALAGPAGAAVAVALGAYASGQLLLSDYVQHYGLTRAVDARGGAEPVAARHSWNAAPRMSAATMLNAPRHSDHHAHPSRPYPALRLDPPDRMPTLPRSLPVMAALALVPPLWRRVMDRRAARWAPGPGAAQGAFAAPQSLAE
ncbi:MAG: fatty acid desaturase, partial [Rhodobacterales bacterium]|nr:fatty acid desaturase [Rhodobacterales bacterium]